MSTDVTTTQKLVVVPAAATGLIPSSAVSGSNQTYGAWVQFLAAAPDNYALAGITFGADSGWSTRTATVDVGYGAAGSETVIASMSFGMGNSGNGFPITTFLSAPVNLIPNGARIAVRVKDLSLSPITLLFYASATMPHRTRATLRTIPTGNYPIGGGFVSVADPNSVWGNSSWAELTPGLSDNALLMSLAYVSGPTGTVDASISAMEIDLATGSAGAETVIGTIRATHATSQDKYNCMNLPVLQFLDSGTRLSWRFRKGVVGVRAHQLAVNYLGPAENFELVFKAQQMTQLFTEALVDEDADADPAPTVTACSGSGTVASGTNPSAGTSLATMTAPLAWVEVTTGGTTYRWGASAINYTTPIEPRVLSFGRCRRALSDGLGGFETPAVSIRLSDYDRTLRGLMNTGVLINQPLDLYVADRATLAAGGTERRYFHGVIRSFKPLSRLEFEIQAEDALTTFLTSANAQEKLVPARLIDGSISDQNPTDRVLDKPVPLIYGSCSDEADSSPVGVVPALYVESVTVSGFESLGNIHKFLVCGHALKNIQAVYLADYVGGGSEPTTRIQAPASAYGSILYVPFQTGALANYTDTSSKRYTFIYGKDGATAIELARSGRIPMLVNVCGAESTGDATGTMLSNPARVFLHVLNNTVAQEATANWLSIASAGTYSLFDTTTFEAAATICAARSYLLAGIIGADYQAVNWRDLGAQFCTQFDFDWGVNRHGQILLAMLDYTSTYSSATVFTDQAHVLLDSLEIDPKVDEVENEIQYVYQRQYAESLHALNTADGTRPNRDPYDGKWISGLQTLADETVITEMGGRPLGLRQSQVQEYALIRDATTAADVAARRLAKKKRPRPVVSFEVTMGDGDGVELGDVIKLTHYAGVGSSGYTTRRLQVRAIDDDLDRFTRRLTCLDVENLLA